MHTYFDLRLDVFSFIVISRDGREAGSQWRAVFGNVLFIVEATEESHGAHLQDHGGLLHHSVSLRVIVHPDKHKGEADQQL